MPDHAQFANKFYMSSEWRRCRAGFLKSKHFLCEECLRQGFQQPADEVHHKQHITRANINDPSITLDWNNLEALCKRHHQEQHGKQRWRVDENGHVEL